LTKLAGGVEVRFIEGALALRPTDFIDVIGKISDLLGHLNVSEH
jgi:hypothetical protein